MLKKQLEIQGNMAQEEIEDKVEENVLKKEMLREEEAGETRNKFMTYFLLFFPTIIIIAIPSTIDGGVMLSTALKIVIAFYQFVTLKTFVDKHYE